MVSCIQQSKGILAVIMVLLCGVMTTLPQPAIAEEVDCFTDIAGQLTASPQTVHVGGESLLTWSVNKPSTCPMTVLINGSPVTGSTGTIAVTPGVTTVYTLSVFLDLIDDVVITLTSTTVTVNTDVCRIAGNTTFWKDALVQCLAKDGAIVIVEPQVDMDLTGYNPIYISENVRFTSDEIDPPSQRRTGTALGPRLFTKSIAKPLFYIRCTEDGSFRGDHVQISGLRIIGPHFGSAEGDSNLEKAIQVTSCLNVEIYNNEIAGWSGQAIYVSEAPENPRMLNPDAVWIHDNFIHHNQHIGGNGYGVVTQGGAYARIERNVFDFNRHAIASSGKAGTGYYAANNLVLKGGGYHGKLFNTYTHQFDIHGDANCPSTFHHLWNCGNAGDQYFYYDNTFQYTRDKAIKIRGVPRVAATIGGNVFAHGSVGGAIELYSKTRVTVLPNKADYDTYGRYGVCDLDGDKKDDFFLPTRKTWWSMSAARMHWVFLKAATDRLETTGLGDFNGDKRCDVLGANGTGWFTSSGGTGDWIKLPGTYNIPFEQLRFADFNGDGRTDIFRRDSSGQWSVISPGVHGWRNLQSSSFPLSALRFGDFTGDGIADVLSLAGGHWSISISGTGSWTKLNSLSTSLSSLFIADVNNDKTDDIVRINFSGMNKGTWQVSWGGKTAWKSLVTVTVPSPSISPLVTPRAFVGQFAGSGGDDLLLVDYRRNGYLYDYNTKTIVVHNLFAY